VKTPAKNIVIMAINVGKRPLHGTKLLVRIAIILSRGESIILHPVTPAALHPKPMHMVSACFPWQHALLKKLSRLKAILGRYPKSSSRVKKGKNMAMGGSMTDTTQATVLKIPVTTISRSHKGASSRINKSAKRFSIQNKPEAINSDG